MPSRPRQRRQRRTARSPTTSLLNGDGSVSQQNSQIAELILKHVDGLAIDAASETAVNGIIQKACKAGIKVVSFDSIASAPCNYQLNFDFTGYKTKEAEWVMKKLGGKGNVIQVRGVKGSAPDHDMYEAQKAVLKKYPNVKVVATVYGQATASVAQSAIANVLPSLPHVDAVLGQGGSDDFGIAQAFEQYGGQYKKSMPIIEGGGSTDFIKWWAEQHKKTGYTTISMNTTPGIGGAAFYLTLELVKGAKAPKKMIMPVATVTQENLSEYTSMPSGMIVSPTYTQDWVRQEPPQGQVGRGRNSPRAHAGRNSARAGRPRITRDVHMTVGLATRDQIETTPTQRRRYSSNCAS